MGTQGNKQKSKRSRQQSAKSNLRSISPIWIFAGAAVILLLLFSAYYYLGQNRAVSTTAAAKLPVEISVSDAAAARDQGAFILDVRQPEEWQDYHIPNSTLIPLGELPNRLNEVPKDKDVIVVCRSGNRSQSGRDILLNAGYSSVSSMSGGVSQWRASGFETTSGP